MHRSTTNSTQQHIPITVMESDAEVAVEKALGLASVAAASATSNVVDVADGLSNAEYRKLIWKLDVHLLPPLFVLWFISLIDRVNIGTARIQGLEKDLGMNPLTNQFNIATGLCRANNIQQNII